MFDISLLIYMCLPMIILYINMDKSKTVYIVLIIGFIPIAFNLLKNNTNNNNITYKYNSGIYKILFAIFVTPMSVGCTYFRNIGIDYSFNSSIIFMFLAAYFFLTDGISDVMAGINDKGYCDCTDISYVIDVHGIVQKLKLNYRKEILRKLLNRYIVSILISISMLLIFVNYIYLFIEITPELYILTVGAIMLYILFNVYVCFIWVLRASLV